MAAAARRYFDKTVDELDLGEMATIAGIARAPSRFAPIANLRAGPAPPRPGAGGDGRRRLHQRRGRGTAGEAGPLVLRPPPDFFRERSPYFAEHVRRDIAKRYGDKML